MTKHHHKHHRHSGAKPHQPEKLYKDYSGIISSPVKIATSNLFIETQQVPVDYMVGAIFNEIGGQELINYSTSVDLVNSSNSIAVVDAVEVKERFSSLNILQTTSILDEILNYDFNLNASLPDVSIQVSAATPFKLSNPTVAYFSADNKSVILEFQDTLDDNLVVEVQFIGVKSMNMV